MVLLLAMELLVISFILSKNALNLLESHFFKSSAVNSTMQQLNIKIMKKMNKNKIMRVKKVNLKKNLMVAFFFSKNFLFIYLL